LFPALRSSNRRRTAGTDRCCSTSTHRTPSSLTSTLAAADRHGAAGRLLPGRRAHALLADPVDLLLAWQFRAVYLSGDPLRGRPVQQVGAVPVLVAEQETPNAEPVERPAGPIRRQGPQRTWGSLRNGQEHHRRGLGVVPVERAVVQVILHRSGPTFPRS